MSYSGPNHDKLVLGIFYLNIGHPVKYEFCYDLDFCSTAREEAQSRATRTRALPSTIEQLRSKNRPPGEIRKAEETNP